jgi:hypothetical protein
MRSEETTPYFASDEDIFHIWIDCPIADASPSKKQIGYPGMRDLCLCCRDFRDKRFPSPHCCVPAANRRSGEA